MANAIASAILTLPLALAAVAPAGSVADRKPAMADDQPELAPTSSPFHRVAAGYVAPRAHMSLVVFGLKPGASAELRRSSDGLFYLDALVNDLPVRFLIDTGANAVVLSASDARRAGIRSDESRPEELAQTAGGQVAMTRVRLRSLEAGPMRRSNVEVAVSGTDLHVSLLGQSWLSQLGSVTIAGDRMVLQ